MKYFISTLKMEGKKIARNPLNKKPPLEFIQVDCADIVLFFYMMLLACYISGYMM